MTKGNFYDEAILSDIKLSVSIISQVLSGRCSPPPLQFNLLTMCDINWRC